MHLEYLPCSRLCLQGSFPYIPELVIALLYGRLWALSNLLKFV